MPCRTQSRLEALPSELLLYILSHLSTASTASFSRTNRHLHHLATTSHKTLHLAIFPKKLHGTLSFLGAPQSIQDDTSHYVTVTLPPEPNPNGNSRRPKKRPKTFDGYSPSTSPIERLEAATELSTSRAILILTPLAPHLRTLSLLLWSPNDSLLTLLATSFPYLRSLNLLFSHPTHRDAALPAFYFGTPPKRSTMWNALAGIGETNQKALRLRSLEKLSIERAGCTSAQLRRIVLSNPGLKELCLKNVCGVDADFVNWLGQQAQQRQSNLQILRIEDCQELSLSLHKDASGSEQLADLAWVARLAANRLQELSILDCDGVDCDVLEMLGEKPSGFGRLCIEAGASNIAALGRTGLGAVNMSGIIQVDPACL